MSKFLFIICAWSTILYTDWISIWILRHLKGLYKPSYSLIMPIYCSPNGGINGICVASNILSRRWRGWGRNWNFVCSDICNYNDLTFSPPIFIGPESDHWQCLSVTDSLTDWLTDSVTFSRLELMAVERFSRLEMYIVKLNLGRYSEARLGQDFEF